jgi:peptide/nickel transport system permease protein
MDKVANVGSSIGVAAPNYFIGTILVLVFAMRVEIFPPTGYVGVTDNPAQWLWHLVLPAIALGLAPAAVVARQLRQGVILERSSNYARTAKAKGLAPSQVVTRHVLRNGSQPAITALGLQLVLLLGGTVIIESLFGMPGVGLLVVDAVRERDFPVLQGVAMMSTLIVVFVNIAVDMIYAALNPRLRR